MEFERALKLPDSSLGFYRSRETKQLEQRARGKKEESGFGGLLVSQKGSKNKTKQKHFVSAFSVRLERKGGDKK